MFFFLEAAKVRLLDYKTYVLETSERGLHLRPSKCLHIYKYYQHPTFGFMHARLETWFPFNVQICINSREWLARQLERRHSRFERADNCFTWLGNPELAQRLMGEQLETDWPGALTAIARSLNPLHSEILAPATDGLLLVGLPGRMGDRSALHKPEGLGRDLTRTDTTRDGALQQ